MSLPVVKVLLFIPLAAAACGSHETHPATTPSMPPVAKKERIESVDAGAPVENVLIGEGHAVNLVEVKPNDDWDDGLSPEEKKQAEEEKKQALRKATVREGNLRLSSGVVIPGPCWNVDKHHRIESGFDPDSFDQDLEIDLDGDGHPDIAKFAGARIWFVTYGLYIMRGNCGYFIGGIETPFGSLQPIQAKSKGLRQIEASWGCHDNPRGSQHGRWAFNGARYMRTKWWADGNEKRCNDPETFYGKEAP